MRLKYFALVAGCALVVGAPGCSKQEPLEVPDSNAPAGAAKADLGAGAAASGGSPAAAAPSGATPSPQ